MEIKSSGWKQKLLALFVSSLLVVVLLVLGEIYCRTFTRINFLDSSRGLFTYGKFGNSFGNASNFEGVAFGETFYTDADGFRVDPEAAQGYRSDSPAILVAGDSVAFGPALKEREAISGNLRKLIPGRSIYNGAVIGYDTFDHRNSIRVLVADRPEIKTVLLFFCLNDITDSSAQVIRSQTMQGPQPENTSASIPRRVNDYLRSRSKLYLWLKNVLIDTQMASFKNDLSAYERGEENVNAALSPLLEISHELQLKGVDLKIFILPHEVQLRPTAKPDDLIPQRMVSAFLAANNIESYDLTPNFQRAEEPRMLFLYGDPIHLSGPGTKLVADAACEHLSDCRR